MRVAIYLQHQRQNCELDGYGCLQPLLGRTDFHNFKLLLNNNRSTYGVYTRLPCLFTLKKWNFDYFLVMSTTATHLLKGGEDVHCIDFEHTRIWHKREHVVAHEGGVRWDDPGCFSEGYDATRTWLGWGGLGYVSR